MLQKYSTSTSMSTYNIHKELEIHYSKKLEEQTFDIRFFSLVRILGIWVLPGETFKSQSTVLKLSVTSFLPGNTHIPSILTRIKKFMSKVCSSNFLD